jgi:hypothetical protein
MPSDWVHPRFHGILLANFHFKRCPCSESCTPSGSFWNYTCARLRNTWRARPTVGIHWQCGAMDLALGPQQCSEKKRERVLSWDTHSATRVSVNSFTTRYEVRLWRKWPQFDDSGHFSSVIFYCSPVGFDHKVFSIRPLVLSSNSCWKNDSATFSNDGFLDPAHRMIRPTHSGSIRWAQSGNQLWFCFRIVQVFWMTDCPNALPLLLIIDCFLCPQARFPCRCIFLGIAQYQLFVWDLS